MEGGARHAGAPHKTVEPLFRVALDGIMATSECDRDLCRPIVLEYTLVSVIFRLAVATARIFLPAGVVGRYRIYGHQFLSDLPPGCVAADPLSPLGELCRVFECGDLAAELTRAPLI